MRDNGAPVLTDSEALIYMDLWANPLGGGGGYEKSYSAGGFEKMRSFLKIVRGGVLRVFCDAETPFVRKSFSRYSFALHIQSFSLPIQQILILSVLLGTLHNASVT